jgi:PAS domain S-box-containing protein
LGNCIHMNQPLHILHLEDNPADTLLVRDLLAEAGVAAEIQEAGGREIFLQKLKDGKWDLILSDFRLPDFNGLDALKIVRQKFPLLPFILVSGNIGEQAAIESLTAGATDYILKNNRERLPSAVRRAVSESAERARLQAAEAGLRQSEKQYRFLFQSNPNPMLIFDLENLKILEVNEAAIQHYGYSREEFLAMTLTGLRVTERDQRSKPPSWDTESKSLIWRHRHKNGSAMEMEVIWSPLTFEGRLAALTMATDMTIRRRVAHRNAQFNKLSHQLSAVTTASEAAIFICDAADELFNWDDFALDLYFAEKDEVVSLLTITTVEGQRVEIPATPQPKAANTLVQRVITRGAELVSALETGEKAGTTMIAPIRKGSLVIGVLFIQSWQQHSYSEHDLETLQTLADQCGGALQRVRAEEDLRHSQRRFQSLFENSPDAIFVEDRDGKILDVNASACALHGLSREQLIGKNAVDDLVPPAHREAARLNFCKLASGQISWVEGENFRADGRSVPIEARVVSVQFDGQPALLFHVRDVSERHAAEMALRSSETLFRSVWENSVDGMRLTDENGIIMAVNGAFSQLVGMTPEQLERKPFSIIYSADNDSEKMLRTHREHFQAGSLEEKRERQYRLHNGRLVVFEITDFYVKSGGKPRLLLSLFRDVTVHKRLEEQLRQSQKMEAIGQLAGGVAHDFNNILTIILGHATLLTLTPLDPKSSASATQIKSASERAAGLTRQLLAFGRKQIVKPRPLDLNRVVGNLSEMLGRLLGEDIKLQFDFSPEPAIVEADSSMIEQILLNLSVNSRDAMPRGGTLSIGIKLCEVDVEHTWQFADARTGNFVCLTHADTGMGIPPENLSRIFEPFFTTKELGKGTGLGLATVYGIVKQHKGWIEVESELGKGTSFSIFLPASSAPIPNVDANGAPLRAPDGTETILVVEDERDLREIITRTLNRHGYRVFQAVDGNNALEIWNEYKDNIDLVFTDVIMPGGVNGRELADRFLQQKPRLKVIYSTGYSADALGKDFRLDPDLNYLQKPYLPDDLAHIIRRRLDEKKAA